MCRRGYGRAGKAATDEGEGDVVSLRRARGYGRVGVIKVVVEDASDLDVLIDTVGAQAPAAGAWRVGGKTDRDHIIMFEVMSRKADARWWRTYKEALESRFRQEWIVVRSMKCTLR